MPYFIRVLIFIVKLDPLASAVKGSCYVVTADH